jgi:hypothetical protein
MSRVVAGSLWPYRLRKNLRLQTYKGGGSSSRTRQTRVSTIRSKVQG